MQSLTLVALLLATALVDVEGKRSSYVRTSLGTAKGRVVKSSHGDEEALVFLGLPYAAPPVGQLRYREPQDVDAWRGILDATEYRASCLSNTSFTTSPQTDIDEDCLYLNVFADSRCGKRRHGPCPVLFYIHGGGFNFDSAPMFPVQALVDHFGTRELVFVTVGYRLGSFGFLNLGSDDVVKRNIAFYDKIKGLEWVQKEIGKFGGDPAKVTIMGHSSGSMSVALLSLTPTKVAGRLFHQGIPMSGPPVAVNKDANVDASFRLAQQAKCATKQQWDNGSFFDEIIDCMRKINALELIGMQRALEAEMVMFSGPTLDGPDGLFPTDVPIMMKSRTPIPYMTGTTSNEFTFPLPISEKILGSPAAYEAACKLPAQALGFKNVDAVSKACVDHYSNTKVLASELMSEMFFVETYKDAQSMSSRGAPVYLYSFDYAKTSIHAADLGFVMGIHTIEQDATDDKVEQLYSGYFADFARLGRPSKDWQPMKTPDGSNYYSIDYSDNGTKIRPHNENAYHPDTIQFWLVEAPRVDASAPIQKATTTAKPQQPTTTVKSLNKNKNNAQVQNVRAQPIIKAEPAVAASSNWETAFWVALCACIALILVFVVLGTLRFCRAKPAPHIVADERTALLADHRNGSVKQVF